jgi:hypothetical protein
MMLSDGRDMGLSVHRLVHEALMRSLVWALFLSAMAGFFALISGLILSALGQLELTIAVSVGLLSMLGGAVVSFLVLTPGMLVRTWRRELGERGSGEDCGEDSVGESLVLGSTVLMLVLGFPGAAFSLCCQF